jgi:hypothetical protein
MKSKFKWRAYLVPILAPLFAVCITGYISFVLDKSKPTPPLNGFPLIFLIAFTIVWLVYGEYRTKVIKVVLNTDHIIIRRYGGFSSEEKISYTDLDGFKISILPSGGRDDEYLYLMKGGKKVCKISDAYHKNFLDLKKEITAKMSDLGYERFSFLDEFKEIFI